MSVIPYAAQVNLGPTLSQYFNISPRLTQSQCVDFTSPSYETTEITQDTALAGTGHFDPWQHRVRPATITCPQNTNGEVVAFSGDPEFLRNRIGNLSAEGGTSIEIGVKWGAALLDPALRPIVTEMIGDNHIDPVFIGRPLNYEDEDALKVLVIMTDGDNYEERRMASAYRSGQTDIYLSNSDGHVSIYHSSAPTDKKFYVPHLTNLAVKDRWQSHPWGNEGNVQRLNWDQVWERYTVWWVATYLYAWPLNPTVGYRDNWIDSVISPVEPWTKNQDHQTICNTVNARNIPIFTVAFEAGPLGESAMRMCATSQSHYFNVEGTDIRGAFRAIAGTINRLRLTQ